MRSARRLGAAFAVALALGCGTAIRNVQGHPLITDESPTLEEAEASIRSSAGFKGWVVKREAEGVLVATLAVRKHRVVVEIRHDATHFDVTYRSSENMNYDGSSRIHQNYNRWVNTLVEDISGMEIHEAGSARWLE